MTTVFTSERRERLLTLLETGRSIKEACDSVSVSRNTVYKWCKDGRKDGASPDKREFAERFDHIRTGGHYEDGLSEADLIRLLEVQARKGSVQALKMLLERPWTTKVPEEEPVTPVLSIVDQLLARRESR